MKILEAKTATLAALALILGLPWATFADNGTRRGGRDVPANMQESIPESFERGNVFIAEQRAKKPRTLYTLTADVSCHDPCDEPFTLKAKAKDASGRGVKGLRVTFSFLLESGWETGEAVTDSSGKASLHWLLDPSAAPQGVEVAVIVECTQGGVTKTATTWFTPNYK
jgi:hypothetical protein